MSSCPACGAALDLGQDVCEACGAAAEGSTVTERGFDTWLSAFNTDLLHSTYRMELALLNVPALVALIAVMRFLPLSLYTALGTGGRILFIMLLWGAYNVALVRWYGKREHGIMFRD